MVALNLGGVQLWAVLAVLPPDEVYFPRDVVTLRPGLTVDDLRWRSGMVDSTDVEVSFSTSTSESYLGVLDRAIQELRQRDAL